MKTGIPESERSTEIKRVADEFSKDNDIIKVTNHYFRYRPRKKFEIESVGKNKEGRFQVVYREDALPKGEGPIREMGYTENGQQYKTDGSYANYRNSGINPNRYLEEHFEASENLEIKAEASGSLHDRLVLWFYNWLTVDAIYERTFDIEFDGTSGFSYLTVSTELTLPMTKDALESRALMGNPRIEIEKRIDEEQHELLEQIRTIDESNVVKLLKFARKEAVKIRLKEVHDELST